jgi:hypothetical protein
MAHEPKEGSGVFFPQKDKKHPKAPDWKGQVLHNGETIKLSGWIKKSSYGEFLSLAVDKWQEGVRKAYPVDVTHKEYPKDSDIPF